MKIFFRLASYKLINKQWVPKYYKITKCGENIVEGEHFFDKKTFDSKKDADKYASDYCTKKGYAPINVSQCI